MQMEREIDKAGVDEEARDYGNETVEAFGQPSLLEPDIEACNDRHRRGDEVVRHDQPLAPCKPCQPDHDPPIGGTASSSLSGFMRLRHPGAGRWPAPDRLRAALGARK